MTGGDSIRRTVFGQAAFFAHPDSAAPQGERRRLGWGMLGSTLLRDGRNPGARI